jgi:hypothetical protein
VSRPRYVTCGECDGAGTFDGVGRPDEDGENGCDECGGRGEVLEGDEE